MHLKSLTLRGFKSFASATTLEFEPGITCVVGPNGSGKSNVVDAIAWVMGEQGAKSLRGGKMEDVIFAGTSDRAPLGRAQVVLTIDNSDAALPIEYAEVSISRTLFRNGSSEYAINRSPCRLLDVQELLSDSGIGREMHVIVGQGQLDSILHATPEDRRGFIEEAAGVLKHRKRKEKALRKLEAMQANLNRLTDLTGELRRQLKPLGKQAEVARRAQVIQSDARDARLRLLADDFVTLTSALALEEADEAALRTRRHEVEIRLAAARAAQAELDESERQQSPLHAQIQQTHLALTALRERYAGLRSLASERISNLGLEADPDAGPDPDELDARADELQAEADRHGCEAQAHRSELADADVATSAAAQAMVAAEREREARRTAAADRREGLARLAGDVTAARTRADQRQGEIARLEASLADARARAVAARAEHQALESTAAEIDPGQAGLDEQYQARAAELAAAQAQVEAVREAELAAERACAGLTARVEALELGLDRQDGASKLLASGEPGLLGDFARSAAVTPGYETAISVALGTLADSVVVGDLEAAIRMLGVLAESDSGRCTLLIRNRSADRAPADRAPADPGRGADGIRRASDLVEVPPELRPAVEAALAGVVVADDLAAARLAVRSEPGCVAVTRDGALLSAIQASGGSARPARLEIAAAVEAARTSLIGARADLEAARANAQQATRLRAELSGRAEEAMARLHEADSRMASLAEQLGQLSSRAQAAGEEADRLASSLDTARTAASADAQTVAELSSRLQEAQSAPAVPEDAEADAAERDALMRHLETARARQVRAQLAVRTAEERAAAGATRVAESRHAAEAERQARARAEQRRERQARETAVARAVLAAATCAAGLLEQSLERAAAERDAAERARGQWSARGRELRAQVDELAAELDQLTGDVHRDEVARTEQRVRIEQVQAKALEEFGIDPVTLVAEYGPEVLVPPAAVAASDEVDPMAPAPQPQPYVRSEQEKRLRIAEKSLALLGRVNPLALEEFAALEERHAFLTAQLEDLRKGRRDLLDIVSDVDERVREVFTTAFADVQREFAEVFARLFPGGEGRLVLTDPADMLTTGIEVEARPAGKRIKRLSLLSGGERSLTAVAFLVALFKARPSPFYLLDEVEAALDDVNLGRLLNLLRELRETSQLLVITHQKRTMEVADALYGVTMRDGVTQVVSQRLRELARV